MKTDTVILDGKPVTVREFYFSQYPVMMDALDIFTRSERAAKPEAFAAILGACADDLNGADLAKATYQEVMAAFPVILEVNGLKPAPKVEPALEPASGN